MKDNDPKQDDSGERGLSAERAQPESREEIARRNPGGPDDGWVEEAEFLARYLRNLGQGVEIGPQDRKVYAAAIGLGPQGAAVDQIGYAESLPFADASLDYVVANHVLEHVVDPVGVLREWRRAVRPGGIIGFNVPDCDHQQTFALNPEHRHLTTDLICREWVRLAGGLELVEQGAPVPGWSLGFICRVMGKAGVAESAAASGATAARAARAPAHLATSEEAPARAPKVAILTLLFNWLEGRTGGGCAHTVGLGQALAGAGCEVRHFYARSPQLGVGGIEAPYPLRGEPIELEGATLDHELIGRRFRQAVEGFAPDVVLITDTWNCKPHLAAAMAGYPVLWRFDAQECLCPLNNCRLLPASGGGITHCPSHQLAERDRCLRCLRENGRFCSALHQAERALAQVENPQYIERLRGTLGKAAAVLVNNPLVEAMVGPYVRRVRVIPPGVDGARFPDVDDGGPQRLRGEPARIFMAGTADPAKGFAVLHAACERLWQRRRDFQLLATIEPPGPVDAFTHYTGWRSQQELPAYYRDADICVVPSRVQDAWPLVAVEAMAAGRPLVASRIGGLQFLVAERFTGLLFAPGDVEQLAQALQQLLDEPDLRRRLGRQARSRFERQGSWQALLERHYLPLLRELCGPSGARLRDPGASTSGSGPADAACGGGQA